MIPFDYITEWRREAPWTTEAQVEQDLIISRAVVCMFAESEVSRLLAFRGGTALYKIHLRPAARYSEDIDLVQVVAGPIGGVLDAIRRALDPWLGVPRRTTKEGRIALIYRMTSDHPGRAAGRRPRPADARRPQDRRPLDGNTAYWLACLHESHSRHPG